MIAVVKSATRKYMNFSFFIPRETHREKNSKKDTICKCYISNGEKLTCNSSVPSLKVFSLSRIP